MKLVLAIFLISVVAGRLSKRVSYWTLAFLLVGIIGVLFIRRITL